MRASIVFLLCCGLGRCACTGGGSSQCIQDAGNLNYSGTSYTLSFGSNVTSGNYVVGIGTAADTSMSSATSTCATLTTQVYTLNRSEITFYGKVTASGSCSVTVNSTNSVGHQILMEEVSGLSGTLDVTGSAAGAYGTSVSSTASTTVANDYIFGIVYGFSGVTSYSVTPASLTIGTASLPVSAYGVDTGTGSLTVTWSWTNSQVSDTLFMAMEPSGGGGSTPGFCKACKLQQLDAQVAVTSATLSNGSGAQGATCSGTITLTSTALGGLMTHWRR